MGSASLRWTSDRGFEVDVEVEDDEVALRLLGVPVPADGTAELERGVDLDRLEILFKASVELQGESGQLQDARLTLVREGKDTFLDIDARCEDVETGDIVPWSGRVEVVLPPGVPVRGGPKPQPTNEDDLDWDDDTTLERLVVNAPETPLAVERVEKPGGGKKGKAKAGAAKEPSPAARGGLQALLKALSSLDDEDELPTEPTEEPSEEVPRKPERPEPKGKASASKAPVASREPASKAPASSPAPNRKAPSRPPDPPPEEEDDQSLGAHGEARSLLDLLVNAENLELEDDAPMDDLSAGVAKILALPWSAERKAHRLSEWLLAQDGVADLFIADDDLAEILERW